VTINRGRVAGGKRGKNDGQQQEIGKDKRPIRWSIIKRQDGTKARFARNTLTGRTEPRLPSCRKQAVHSGAFLEGARRLQKREKTTKLYKRRGERGEGKSWPRRMMSYRTKQEGSIIIVSLDHQSSWSPGSQ